MLRLRLMMIPVALLSVLVNACTPEAAPITRPQAMIANDLAGGSVTFAHVLPGEQFSLVTEFSTTEPITYWHITEPKVILMKASIVPNPDVIVDVLVEHVHADAFIMADYAGWDGMLTDSMDDSIHGVEQPGFWISKYPYQEYFSIQGYSDKMYQSWAVFYSDAFASSETKPVQLTEKNLIEYGKTTGQKFQIVWDLAVRYPGEPYFHTVSVIDHFAVPIDQTPGHQTQPTQSDQ